jgi:hypothetical protein
MGQESVKQSIGLVSSGETSTGAAIASGPPFFATSDSLTSIFGAAPFGIGSIVAPLLGCRPHLFALSLAQGYELFEVNGFGELRSNAVPGKSHTPGRAQGKDSMGRKLFASRPARRQAHQGHDAQQGYQGP